MREKHLCSQLGKCNPYYNLLGILKLDNIFKLKMCTFAHRIKDTNNCIPAVFSGVLTPVSDVHHYRAVFEWLCKHTIPFDRPPDWFSKTKTKPMNCVWFCSHLWLVGHGFARVPDWLCDCFGFALVLVFDSHSKTALTPDFQQTKTLLDPGLEPIMEPSPSNLPCQKFGNAFQPI